MICRAHVKLLFIVIAIANTQSSLAREVDTIEDAIPIVLTPTRLRQSLDDVPASVTIITSEMINMFGIRSLPDALRMVPGMAVTQVSGSDYRINYHGTNILMPRRMNVLIDGMSIYRPAFSRVDWAELPIAIEDIEQIVVTRGPNSASYGANSMLAIINIISKHPDVQDGATISVTAGSLGTRASLARFAGAAGNSTNYRITVEHQGNNGFDSSTENGFKHDSFRNNKLNFRSVTEIDNDTTLDFQASLMQGMKEVEYADAYQANFPDIHFQEYYLSALWKKNLSENHAFQIQAYTSDHKNQQSWTTCVPTTLLLPEMGSLWRSNPDYAYSLIYGRKPSGGTAEDNTLAVAAIRAIGALGSMAKKPTCVDTNQDYTESRLSLAIQDTYVFSDTLRMVSGAEYRRDNGDSQTYLNGKVSNDSVNVFSNIEYKPIKSVSINIGGFLERDSLTGSSFSPRIAINKHLNKNNTLRFILSKATRTPDIQEQNSDWSYRTTNYSTPLNGATEGGFFQSAKSPGHLSAEKITSTEIGYFGNFSKYGLLVDAKIFEDQLTDLISEKLQLSSYNPTNNNTVRQHGIELQTTYAPSERWMVHAGYSYLVNKTTAREDQTQYARNSGTVGIAYAFDDGLHAGFSVYQYGANTAGQSNYGREDLTLSKTFVLDGKSFMTTALTVSHLDSRISSYQVDTTKTRDSRYNDAMQYYLTFKFKF